jgi:hypothetical protein
MASERQGLRTAQPGCDAAVTEVETNQPTAGRSARGVMLAC